MPDIDRTQVVIETSIDSSKSDKKLDALEKKLNSLEKPRTINLNSSFEDITKSLQEELAGVNQKISDLFKHSKSMNNISGMGELVERKSALQNALAELKKAGPGISSEQLQSILSTVQVKVKDETPKAPQTQQQQQAQPEEKKGGSGGSGFNFGKLAGAVVGIQTVVNFVRKIASQNENLNQAVNNVVTVLANVFEPVLNFLATLINTIAVFIGKLFGVSTKAAKSSADTAQATKALANFDELNNIGGSSGAAGGGGIDLGTDSSFMKLLDDVLNGLKGIWQFILGVIQLIGGLIGGLFATIIALVQGLIAAVVGVVGTVAATIIGVINGIIYAIIAFVQGMFNTIYTWIADLINVVVGMFTGFIDGFNKAREDGHGIIVSIFLGL